MTLQEQFEKAPKVYNENLEAITDYTSIANNFAIEFHRWMRVNDTKENADKYFHYTDKDMLNAFKEEKGL